MGRDLVQNPIRCLGRSPGTIAAVAAVAALAWGCATAPQRLANGDANDDVLLLNRLTYGITPQTLADARRQGRSGFLNAQLTNADMALPADIAQQIDAMEITRTNPLQQLIAIKAERERIKALADPGEMEQARKALREQGNRLAKETQSRELLRALYSRAQLREQLVAFWLNHFSVFKNKGEVRGLIGDYAEHAVRPHVLGLFRELVLATLRHPAMLEYLDNAHNAAGHINENYARELMELHTLGVNGGYTQQDVQNLARVLTGVGVYTGGEKPRLKPVWQPLYRREAAFEFNPARHDFGPKTLLGTTVLGVGYAEVENAVDLLVRSDACAHFISTKLARYFVAGDPPAALIERMARTFHDTDGNIIDVLRTLFSSREFTASLGQQFKDPLHYVVSALRLTADARPITNLRPALNWLDSLGEPLFGHQTPDGYAITEAAWAGSGQMSRRLEIARAISARADKPIDNTLPQAARPWYYATMQPLLSKASLTALQQAKSQQEWTTFLLASPEFNYR